MRDDDVSAPEPDEVEPTDNSSGAPTPPPAEAGEGKPPEDVSPSQVA